MIFDDKMILFKMDRWEKSWLNASLFPEAFIYIGNISVLYNHQRPAGNVI